MLGSGNSKICKVGVLFPGVYNLGRERMTNIVSKERRHQLKLGGQERFSGVDDTELQPGVSCWCAKYFCHQSLSTASSAVPYSRYFQGLFSNFPDIPRAYNFIMQEKISTC